MSELTVALLMRNEASRFLPSALRVWSSFADNIVALDDNSQDNSVEIAKAAGAQVFHREPQAAAWGHEAPARQQLFDLAVQHTPDSGYIMVMDADMIPARDPRPLMDGTCSGWAFALYDIWGSVEDGGVKRLLYRHDQFWNGHLHPRIWMIRKPKQSDYVWSDRGLHCGHFPVNLEYSRGVGFAPQDFSLIHMAYSDPFLRAEKYEQYKSRSDVLFTHERSHAQSIIDSSPNLYPLPFIPEYSIEREFPQEEAA